MTAPANPPIADPFRLAGADLMRVTLGQLRAWEAQALRQVVIVPKADEEAWEGTEIDALRTVL